MLTRKHIQEFIFRHHLPEKFQGLITEHYVPLVDWLIKKRSGRKILFIGISGAQGTGKSTLADFLRLALAANESWHVAVLSIDDFYLTRDERKKLSETVHPLLLTRGVPGTHDLPRLTACIERLRTLAPGEERPLPRFDKARDDRAAVETWPSVTGPIDLIILEGWCIGSRPQSDKALSKPVNELERDQDPDGIWRRFVNRQLEEHYMKLFAELDGLVFLKAPNFNAVYRWRLDQEEKLATVSDDQAGIMDHTQIAAFIQHYERLTKANLTTLPKIADVIIELDDAHDGVRSIYR